MDNFLKICIYVLKTLYALVHNVSKLLTIWLKILTPKYTDEKIYPLSKELNFPAYLN